MKEITKEIIQTGIYWRLVIFIALGLIIDPNAKQLLLALLADQGLCCAVVSLITEATQLLNVPLFSPH